MVGGELQPRGHRLPGPRLVAAFPRCIGQAREQGRGGSVLVDRAVEPSRGQQRLANAQRQVGDAGGECSHGLAIADERGVLEQGVARFGQASLTFGDRRQA